MKNALKTVALVTVYGFVYGITCSTAIYMVDRLCKKIEARRAEKALMKLAEETDTRYAKMKEAENGEE